MYVFELTGVSGTTPVAWYRTTADTYSGGAAYRNQSWINGNDARDFSVAIYVTGATAGTTAQCTVDYNNVHQRIDGFGASSAWRGTWTTAQANMFFSTNSGTGATLDGKTNFSFNGVDLSLLRNHIVPGGTTTETNIMVMAQARGARVWSTPWSPPAAFKNTNSINGGDYLGGASVNQAYASQLAGYVASMKNITTSIFTPFPCRTSRRSYTPITSRVCGTRSNFTILSPTFTPAHGGEQGVRDAKSLSPRAKSWAVRLLLLYHRHGGTQTSVADVGIIAGHNYDGGSFNFDTGATTVPFQQTTDGKGRGETEVSKKSRAGRL